MSAKHIPNKLLEHPRYVQRHVGGLGRPKHNQAYIQNQLDLIANSDRRVPPNVRYSNKDKQTQENMPNLHPSQTKLNGIENLPYSRPNTDHFLEYNYDTGRVKRDIYMREDYDKYDDYTGYIYNHGLLQDGSQSRRFRTNYINVNSKFRQTLPSLVTGDPVLLADNPITFSVGSNIIFISHPNNSFTKGDLITISGVFGNVVTLRTFDDNNNPAFVIPAGASYMQINYMHGLPSTFMGDIQVEFQDIEGDRGSTNAPSFLGNIPINVLNDTFELRLSLTQADFTQTLTPAELEQFAYSPDHFFVVLPVAMQDVNPPYVLQPYNFMIIFQSVAGVPLNIINANYPITPNNLTGFQVITSRFDNGYTVQLPISASLATTGGGSAVTVSLINEVNPGYPNPNYYIIDLGKIYTDIVSVMIKSMEFPNSSRTIRDFPADYANNKIYWSDIDDGDYVYSIAVPPGNYTPSDLVTELETLFMNTPRIAGEVTAPYSNNHYIQVNINQNTDQVTFNTYKQAIVTQPFTDIVPGINSNSQLGTDDPNAMYAITVTLPNHGITEVGTQILIQNAIDDMGIAAAYLNGQQTVSSIINANEFTFTLPKINLEQGQRTNTYGGVAVTIFVPDKIQLLFDYPDTLGAILGFRNPGNINSITPFASSITNSDPYLNDIDTNNLGQTVNLTNNAIQLSGDNYVLMMADPLTGVDSIGPVPYAFAKILLCDIPGKVLFNTHVHTLKIYEDPLHELENLEVEFLTPDGVLYDFAGLDHSYMLEIVTVNDIPEGTGISASTGRNYNLAV